MKLGWHLLILAGLLSGCTRSRTVDEQPKPKLVVFLCLDQLRWDCLSRFGQYFSQDGFNYLLEHGATFSNCRYRFATTHTAVGHSSMVSGADPCLTGIIGNDWYDARQGKAVSAVLDPSERIVGAEPGTRENGRSPRQFIGSTVGDQLKMHTNDRARVFSVSNKDRASVFMGGKMADAAYWIDDDLGAIVTSTYYMSQYPDWVLAYRQEKPLTRWMGQQWSLSLSEELYPQTDQALKKNFDVRYGMGDTFPHNIGSKNGTPDKNYFNALRSSPFGTEAILDFTERLIQEEKLGEDDITDVLFVSISVTDRVAHEYGPWSVEMMDATIKVDGYLSSFFRFIQDRVGSQNVLYILTSDHGGPPIPEIVRASGIDADRLVVDSVRSFIERLMVKTYGTSGRRGRNYVVHLSDPNIYLNETLLSEKNIDKKVAERYIAEALKAEFRAVYRVYGAEDILSGQIIPDGISDQVVRSFYPERSGHLVVVLKPYFIWDWNGKGTDHGQPYSYDTHVPLILAGTRWIRAGRFAESCSPADIAPTLSEILQIEYPPGSTGRILGEALVGIR